MTDTTVPFFHSPNARWFGTPILLDELESMAEGKARRRNDQPGASA